jgi:endonuclease/exonuclease/phosphatase family metal-dependent hydrolase
MVGILFTGCDNSLTVTEGKSSQYQITVSDLDNIATAAAEYLAHAVRESTEADIPIISQEESVASAKVPEKEILLKEGTPFNGNDYELTLKDSRIIITAKEGMLFEAIKAIADKWVDEECGIDKNGDLIINGTISKALNGLDIEITDSIRILSQNIRYTDDPNGNSIKERAPRFLALLKDYQPDIIGVQEATKRWMDFFENNLGDTYGIIGCSRNGRRANDGEWNAILYRKDRFELIDGETFWLSETPDDEATKLEGSIYRICTWALFEDKSTGKLFTVNNTHLQNGGDSDEIRAQQVTILLDYLRDNVGYLELYPAFLTGDFNAGNKSSAYALTTEIFRDSKISALKNISEINHTYHGYGKSKSLIDYCFHTPYNTAVLDYKILDDQYEGYVSDHYGVLITAVIN